MLGRCIDNLIINYLLLFNAGGVIDSDYTGSVGVALVNLRNVSYDIRRGDRIAQVLFVKIYDGGVPQAAIEVRQS